MVSYWYNFGEDTSTTTSCTSNDASKWDGQSSPHIGDIHTSPMRSRLEAYITTENHNHGNAAPSATTSDLASVCSQDESHLTYDTMMREIRQEVWAQVEQSKAKREKKHNASIRQRTEHTYEHLSEASSLLETVQESNTRQSQQASQPYPISRISPTSIASDPNLSEKPTRSEIARESCGNLKSIATIGAQISSTGTSVLPSLIGQSRPPQTDVEKSHGSRFPTATERADPTNERELIWGETENVLRDTDMILEEPTDFDPFGDIDQEAKDEPHSVSSVSQESRTSLEVELDSVFESIVSLELEGVSDDNDMPNDATMQLGQVPVQSQSPSVVGVGAPLLTAKIFGSTEDTILCIPLFLLERRENEMFTIAFHQGIKPDRWRGSLLSRKLKALKRESLRENVVTLDLDPEAECAEANYSQVFLWQSWIHECIDSFYKTGSMRVPDSCNGWEILVALQYFGLLYNPDQLLFSSFETYYRVRLWSEYFTFRNTMAIWLLKTCQDSNANYTSIFATCPYPLTEGAYIHIGANEAEILDGGLDLNPKQYGKTQSCSLVFGFFNEKEGECDGLEGMDALMREDFCSYFEKLSGGTKAMFSKKRAVIGHPEGTREQLHLSVLYIRQVERKQDPPTTYTPGGHSTNSSVSHSSNFSDSNHTNSIASQTMPKGCQLIDTPRLVQCAGLEKTTSRAKKACEGIDQGMPIKKPECATTSSYPEYKESQILPLWTPRKSGPEDPIQIAQSASTSVQHIEPLPTMSVSERSSDFEGPLNADQIYKDLWLQEVALRKGWEKIVDSDQSITSIASLGSQAENSVLLEESNYVQNQHGHKTSAIYHCLPQFQYKPQGLICDAVEQWKQPLGEGKMKKGVYKTRQRSRGRQRQRQQDNVNLQKTALNVPVSVKDGHFHLPDRQSTTSMLDSDTQDSFFSDVPKWPVDDSLDLPYDEKNALLTWNC